MKKFKLFGNSSQIEDNGAYELYKALSAEDGIRNFLLPSYDALHTQSIEYIADEVLEYLKAKNARV